MSARTTLAAALALAEVARRDPSAANRQAVRAALGMTARLDAAGMSASGHGYNPYRDKGGKFGAGAHKEHSAAVPPSTARAELGKARTAAEAARKNPTAENKATARKAVGDAAAIAGKKPARKQTAASAEKMAVAKEASGHAHKASEKAHMSGDASDHRAAVLAHERAGKAQRAAGGHQTAIDHDSNASSHLRHAETIDSLGHGAGGAGAKQATPPKTIKDPGLEHLEKAGRSEPTPHGHLIDAIGNGGIRDDRGNVVGLTPTAQSAMRDHFGMLAEREGAVRHGGAEQHKLVSRSVDEIGAASGMHYPTTGRIDLSAETLKHLGQHAGDDAYDHKRAMQEFTEFDGHGGRGVIAYSVMMHETFHGYGPHFEFADNNSGNVARYQFVNEVSTEMAARHITAKVHGFEAHKMKGGGYDDVMREAVGHAAEVSGVSHERAFAAVSEAAMSLKRQGHTMTPDEAISHMADHVSKSLGAHDASLELQGRWSGLAHEMNQRYPWP